MIETLILIPTAGEYKLLIPRLSRVISDEVRAEICGFGPVSAAARTVFLTAHHQPRRILLVGIAGALNRQLAPGQAGLFDSVAMYGIGAGAGDTFRTATELGWHHWLDERPGREPVGIGDQISLAHPESETVPDDDHNLLLTVCSASATQKEVRDRLEKFPDAVAEDMEGFSVALAARMCGLPLTIVRGISNLAGDRDKGRWRIADALNSAADLVLESLA